MEETFGLRSLFLGGVANFIQLVRFSIWPVTRYLNGATSSLDGNHQRCNMDTGLVTRYRSAVEMANICVDIQTWGEKTLAIKLEIFACAPMSVVIG